MWDGQCLMISPVVTYPHVSSKKLPSLVFPLRANPWQVIANGMNCPKCCTHSSYDAPTHPPTTRDNWFPSYSPLTLVHYIPPHWLKCTVLLENFKLKIHLHSHNSPISFIYYVRNLDETPRVNLFISIMFYLWCDQVVSGLLANKFLVPSFENSSGK